MRYLRSDLEMLLMASSPSALLSTSAGLGSPAGEFSTVTSSAMLLRSSSAVTCRAMSGCAGDSAAAADDDDAAATSLSTAAAAAADDVASAAELCAGCDGSAGLSAK